MMEFLPYVLLFNALATIIAGSGVYLLDRKRKQNTIWLIYNIIFSIWNFSVYKALISEGSDLVSYWVRVSYGALFFIVPLFLHFLSLYSDRAVFKKRVLNSIHIVFLLLFVFFIAFPQEVIKSVSGDSFLRYGTGVTPAFNIFTVIFVGFVFCGFYYLLRTGKSYLRFKRNQRIWLFTGMLFGLGAPFNFLLYPYGFSGFPFGAFFVLPYLAISSYIILKYYVLEAETVLNKGVVLSYFLLIVIGTHAGILYLLQSLTEFSYFNASILSGCAILTAFLVIVHYTGINKLSRATDRMIYGKKISYYRFLEEFQDLKQKTVNLNDLTGYILDSIIDIIGIESATVYLYNERKADFELIAGKGIAGMSPSLRSGIPATSPFIKFLREGNIYVAGEKEDFKEDYDMDKIKEALNIIKAQVSIPLYYSLPIYYSRDIIGFLNLGRKKEDIAYTKEDIDILNAFGREISAAIDSARLYSRAIEDDLTGLYRLGYFNKRIYEEIERAARYDRPFSILMIDVDDFKEINDSLGHQAGDVVLRRIAHEIKANIRKVDIAARYGGEEFSIIMPETNLERAAAAAERLRSGIEGLFRKSAGNYKVTISIGVALYKKGMRRYELVKAADDALYKAKRAGKNRVEA